MALFPLFPGTDELDQINKIHAVLGTPSPDLLAAFKRNASHMDFNFPNQEGSGIVRLLPHGSPELVVLLNLLLSYNPDDRLSARQALKHPYFAPFRDVSYVHLVFIVFLFQSNASVDPGSQASTSSSQQPMVQASARGAHSDK
jgi:serine/threonine protein kinase